MRCTTLSSPLFPLKLAMLPLALTFTLHIATYVRTRDKIIKKTRENYKKKVKEESEKAVLMLNLKKTKIMTRTLKEFILEKTEMEITNCYTF